MKILRPMGVALISAVLVTTLSGCIGFPSVVTPTTGGGTTTEEGGAAELAGTTWGGTDSDGDEWGLEFQADGTIGLTYNGSNYDDPSDVWALAGDQLAISVSFDDGDVALAGTAPAGATSIDLDGSYTGGTFTLTITQ